MWAAMDLVALATSVAMVVIAVVILATPEILADTAILTIVHKETAEQNYYAKIPKVTNMRDNMATEQQPLFYVNTMCLSHSWRKNNYERTC